MDLEKIMEQLRRDRLIICPHCGYEHHDPEMLQGLITYHGEEEPQEVYCYQCDKTFFVNEHVSRTFEEKKTIEEFDL